MHVNADILHRSFCNDEWGCLLPADTWANHHALLPAVDQDVVGAQIFHQQIYPTALCEITSHRKQ
ncbi:hypothetical protein Bpfe_000368, partial [Biomphalaria pfeifferi]